MIAEPSRTRELRPEDLPAIGDLWVAAWRQTLPQIDFEARRAWLEGHLAALAAEGAYILVSPIEGPPNGFITVNPVTGYIDQVAIAVESWGTGLGATLLDEARRFPPARLELLVNRDNPRAIRFYEKYGFAKAGESISPLSGLPLWRMVWCSAE